jgi:hypothetical protein
VYPWNATGGQRNATARHSLKAEWRSTGRSGRVIWWAIRGNCRLSERAALLSTSLPISNATMVAKASLNSCGGAMSRAMPARPCAISLAPMYSSPIACAIAGGI